MHMHWVDWSIVLGLIGGLGLVAIIANKHTKSVSDFLAANRCAKRYLLTMAEGMAGLAAITIIGNFEKIYRAGFGGHWWGQMTGPLGMIIALSGWVIYRFRQTRALTMAQFFEMRYSRSFRIFAGMVAWFSGIINYGIFPAVTSRFIVYFSGLPDKIMLGDWQVLAWHVPEFAIPTILPVMAILLTVAVSLALAGGQIAIMITDFLQGQFVNIVCLVVLAFVFLKLGWGEIIGTLRMAPEGRSMINPFKQGSLPDFNVWYFMIMAFMQLYGHMAWQGNQGYYTSAISPHEAKMGRVLGSFRGGVQGLLFFFLPIMAYVLLNSPSHTAQAGVINDSLSQIPNAKQMITPVALSHMLPVGLTGLFCAIMIAAAISTDDTYLHSWGSIFIQDVVMPFRKKPLDPQLHMKLLRVSIIGVATFAFFWSWKFPMQDYVNMYLQATGSIFLGGAGSAIVGGLYWKRGNKRGAWSGMITGCVVAAIGILLINVIQPRTFPWLKERYPDVLWVQKLALPVWFNGNRLMLISSLCSVVAYVAGSLGFNLWGGLAGVTGFTGCGLALSGMQPTARAIQDSPWKLGVAAATGFACYVLATLMTKKAAAFDMDKLLNRGKYAVEGDIKIVSKPTRGWKAFGMGAEFTRGDKAIYILQISLTLFWFAIFLCGMTWYVVKKDISDDTWAKYWLFHTIFVGSLGVIFTVWFLIGGFSNLRDLFRMLRKARRDVTDDGWVPQEAGAPVVEAIPAGEKAPVGKLPALEPIPVKQDPPADQKRPD